MALCLFSLLFVQRTASLIIYLFGYSPAVVVDLFFFFAVVLSVLVSVSFYFFDSWIVCATNQSNS